MNLRQNTGIFIIEIIIFIIVLGIALSALGGIFNTILLNSNSPSYHLTAAQLAGARMNIILQQKQANGFNNLSDPCNLGSVPAACTDLNTFASSKGFAITSSVSAVVNGIVTATVNVTGLGKATLVTEFMQ